MRPLQVLLPLGMLLVHVAGLAASLNGQETAPSASSVLSALPVPSAFPSNLPGIKTGLKCGLFATASKNDVVRMVRDLHHRFPDGSSDTCGSPAKSCTRQACRNTSGLYDNDEPISINCADMNSWLLEIVDGCCPASVMVAKGISGQLFSSRGWNVVIAYANCNDDPGADRPSNFAVWGPNGVCE